MAAIVCGNAAAMIMTPPVVEACLQFQDKSSDLEEGSAAIFENFLIFSLSGKYLNPTLRELSIVVNGNREATEQQMGVKQARELLSRRQSKLTDLALNHANSGFLHMSSEFYMARNDALMRDITAPPTSPKSCDAKVWGYFEPQDGNEKFCSSHYACKLTCTALSCSTPRHAAGDGQ